MANKTKEVFFLKDSEINEWLTQGFAQREFAINFMGINNSSQLLMKGRLLRIAILHFKYIKLAFNSLWKSKNEDIIICFLDVLGLYVFLLSKVLFKKRDIIVINIMFNDNDSIITIIKLFLYKWMLKSKFVYPTVTSVALRETYRKIFNLPEKYFYLLHDSYGKLEKYKKPYSSGDNYVFSGGTNGRDWNTLVKIASLLPEIRFVIVGPQQKTLGVKYPANIDYYYNISLDRFQDLIKNCSLLTLPLNTVAPAGLIVLFTAGLLSKPVITTDNVAMNEYITSGENGILVEMGDFEEFATQAQRLLYDTKLQQVFGEKLFTKIESIGSPMAFVDRVIDITNELK
mgnify:FL=1